MSPNPESRPDWVPRYLDRLGVADPGPPTIDGLRALHRAHVERVPFENIGIQLGRPPGIAPDESIARIADRQGGYCFHLNGAFAALLGALGYQVAVHRGHVLGMTSAPPPAGYGNHMAVTVVLDGGTWMVDVGLGNALHEPIPLRVGEHLQGPYTFGLETLPDVADGWRFVHDPVLESFRGMEFTLAPAVWTDFLRHHAELSTSRASGFVKHCRIFRRDAAGADFVFGTVLHRDEGGHRTGRELTTPGEWFEAVGDVFGLDLSELSGADRAALWQRVSGRQPSRPA